MTWFGDAPDTAAAEPAARAALVAVIGAPDSRSATVTVALARALAASADEPGAIVLADLTLDAPHRALHGLDPDGTGLEELVVAGRFAPPLPDAVDAALHPARGGYRVLPGLRRHHDWIGLGDEPVARALEAVRQRAGLVVTHVDRDLEGERDTGSLDIEDRNALARIGVGAADLVVVAAGTDRAGRLALVPLLASLAAFGVAPARTVVASPGPRRTGRASALRVRTGSRPDVRLAAAVRARMAAVGPNGGGPGPAGSGRPQRIQPGSLGAGQAIDGWITPRTPQQP